MDAAVGKLSGDVRTTPSVIGPGQAPGSESSRYRLLGRGGWAAAIGGMAVLLVIVGGSVLLDLRDGDAVALTRKHIEARNAVDGILDALVDAETGQRGFLLTGRGDYLQPYESAASALPGRLEALAGTLEAGAAEPAALRDGAALRATALRKLAELKRTLELARAGDVAGAIALLRTDAGKRDMDEARALADRLVGHLTELMDREFVGVVRGGRLLMVLDIVGFLLVVAFAGAVTSAARRGTRAIGQARSELAAANAQLERVNEGLEEKVAQRTGDLTEANEEIQRFAYIVSHDLRAPLVNIMGFTSELATAGQEIERFVAAAAPHMPAPAVAAIRATIEEDLSEALRFIKTSAAKMDRLIGAILQLSREGRRVLTPERVAMGPLFHSIAESMAVQLAQRDARIEMGHLPDVVSDRLALEQVFSNLVENAVKYLKPGRAGRIAVRARVAGTDAVFEIEDNGRGIAPRDHERIFELFRRAGDQNIPGEGIGLAHVRALVRRLGGKIDCVSALDVGSTFRVQVPLVLVQGGANG